MNVQPSLEEQPDVIVHQGTFDIMQPEHFRDRSE